MEMIRDGGGGDNSFGGDNVNSTHSDGDGSGGVGWWMGTEATLVEVGVALAALVVMAWCKMVATLYLLLKSG